MTPSATKTDLKVVKVKKKSRWDVKPDSMKNEDKSPRNDKQQKIKAEPDSPSKERQKIKQEPDSPKETSSTAIMCEQCGKAFSTKQNYYRHKKLAHRITPGGEKLEKAEKLSFICALCNKVLGQKASLIRHLQWTHPEAVGSITEKLFKCDVKDCTFQTKHQHNLFRHKAKVHYSGKVVVEKNFFQCSLCPRKFSVLRNLRFHERKTHNVGGLTFVIKRKCPLCSFLSTDHDKKEIHNHFEKEHNIKMEWEVFELANIEEFVAWKKETEKLTLTCFVRASISPKLLTFQCRRSGVYKKKGHDKRKLKLSGSCKINGFCPAIMNVKALEDNKVEVSYLSTHVGHKNEPEHVRTTPEEREAMKAERLEKKKKSTPRGRVKKSVQIKQNTQVEMAKLMIEVQEEMAEECADLSPQTIYIEHVGEMPANVEECLALHNVGNCQIIQNATVENCQIIQEGTVVENCQIIQQGVVENCHITVLTSLNPSVVENSYDLQEEKDKFLKNFIRCINESVASLEDLEYVKQHCQAILPTLRNNDST